MRRPNNRRRNLVPLGAVTALLALLACSEAGPVAPTDAEVQFAKGGGGPKVEAADPSSAPQDITLDVRVIGSGFDEGSTVKFLLAGQSTENILTNSSTFVDRKNLIANITISDEAEIALYDIEVLSFRGKKGIGTELFGVKKKGNVEPEFDITTTDLGILTGRSASVARSIVSTPDGSNIRIVGGGGDGAFYWTGGVMVVELTTPPVESASILATEAVDINDGGQIVGKRFVNRGDPEVNGYQPLFWSSSTTEAIILPMRLTMEEPARSSYATALNSGQDGIVSIVGQSFDHSDDPNPPHAHAMLWTVDEFGTVTTRDLHKETFAELEPGFLNSLAEGINDRGQVVGRAFDGVRERAFLWDDGAVTWLDVHVDPSFLSFAFAINNADPVQVIGGAHDQTGGSRRALLWKVSGGTVLKTDELPVLAGFRPGLAVDLNDRGEAVGGASPTNGQDGHAILWTFDQTGERIAVDLGLGSPAAIDNSASPAGLTRVVGSTTITSGKGRKKTSNARAILWEVEPIP